jgi:hypothetical protein
MGTLQVSGHPLLQRHDQNGDLQAILVAEVEQERFAAPGVPEYGATVLGDDFAELLLW